jgi:hypothetical protein
MKTILRALILELRYWYLRRLAVEQLGNEYVELVEMRTKAAIVRENYLASVRS